MKGSIIALVTFWGARWKNGHNRGPTYEAPVNAPPYRGRTLLVAWDHALREYKVSA